MDSLGGQQLLRKDGAVVQADEALTDKKIIAFYFSAHWCPPCRLFTPVLAEFYSVSSYRCSHRCWEFRTKSENMNFFLMAALKGILCFFCKFFIEKNCQNSCLKMVHLMTFKGVKSHPGEIDPFVICYQRQY